MQRRSFSKFILPLVAALLILGAGVGLYQAQRAASDLEAVAVAKSAIAPFATITKGQVDKREIPKGAVTKDYLTWAEYEDTYVNGDKPKTMVSSQLILAGQPIDKRMLAANAQGSFAIVSADERVISVATDVPGSVLSKIQVGDVVDVRSAGDAGSDGITTQFAKVLCVTTSADACRVRTNGVTAKDGSGVSADSGKPINLLLAVSEVDASGLAGQDVVVALNPFCSVALEDKGSIEAGDFLGERCAVPSSRLASSATASDATQSMSDAGDPATEQTPADQNPDMAAGEGAGSGS